MATFNLTSQRSASNRHPVPRRAGWRFEGLLCAGEQRTVGGHDTGAMWECPFLVSPAPESHLLGLQGAEGGAAGSSAGGGGSGGTGEDTIDREHVMCVSPYPHHGPSTNSSLYWLGRYQNGRFDLGGARGVLSGFLSLQGFRSARMPRPGQPTCHSVRWKPISGCTGALLATEGACNVSDHERSY